VRSESDYSRSALVALAAKRSDYFEAGTTIVWDVDPIAECIHIYTAETPDQPITCKRGQFVDAEPTLPGFRIDVDWIFD
jgi:Uma2 family endonuclease